MKADSSRAPYYIDWAITYRCNLRCSHCRGMPDTQISTERALSLLGEMRELNPGWLLIEGGEPLMREDLFDILSRARSLGHRLFIISNGMLLTDEIVDRFSRIGAGVMVSIDSPDAETFEKLRRGADFPSVVRAAKRCASAGILDAINFTLTRDNLPQVSRIFVLASVIGAERINILGLKPCERNVDKMLTPREYREAIEISCRASVETGIKIFFDEPFFRVAAREWGLTYATSEDGSSITIGGEPGCILGKYLFITPDGDVWPCSFSPHVAGNVTRQRLPVIWENMRASGFMRKVMNPRSRGERCKSCRHLSDCMGCRARAYRLTNNWFASDPACPLQ